MRILIRILKSTGWIILSIVIIAAVFLVFLTLTDYQPKLVEAIKVEGNSDFSAGNRRQFTVLLWNTGYCAMGKEADFFYDGGEMTKPSFDSYQRYLNGIYNEICKNDTIDFLLLQEVDKDARRSYYIDQVDLLTKGLIDFNFSFAQNYYIKFIPFPILSPLSKVSSGMLNLMRFKPSKVSRLASPVNFEWPKRLFFPDRCMMISRFPLSNNRELVLINIHNSAFSDGVLLRRNELDIIKATVIEEYNKGNYVIAGGDWNLYPPGFKTEVFSSGEKAKSDPEMIDNEFLPGNWQWIFDPAFPTNRDANTSYRKGITGVNVFDFFLISPNVKVDEIRTFSNGFSWSDHQPVYLRFSLPEGAISAGNPALNNK